VPLSFGDALDGVLGTIGDLVGSIFNVPDAIRTPPISGGGFPGFPDTPGLVDFTSPLGDAALCALGFESFCPPGTPAPFDPGIPTGGAQVPNGTAPVSMAGCGNLFRAPTSLRVSPVPEISQIGPDGRCHTWKYAGRPILFSRDIAVARRVDKIARKARRARPR